MKDLFLFTRILFLVLVTPFLIRLKKLPELADYFAPQKNSASYNKDRIIKYTDFLVGWKIRMFIHACLIRSLILYKLLGETGTKVVINFGVAKGRSRVRGHCWLTLDGKVYLEQEGVVEKFVKIDYTIPRAE